MRIGEGDTVGNYEIETDLGSGGFGQIFLAIHIGTHERVVLKFPHTASYGDAAKEAQALGHLKRHDAIVTVRDVVSDDIPYVVLEHVEGIGLDGYLSVHAPLTPVQWWQTFRPLLSGVQHLHAAGIVHRDIKPANIVLRDSNPAAPVIIDFGAARDKDDFLTQIIGSGMYMDPTIADFGALQPDPSWDIYSLAVLSFEAMFSLEFAELSSSVDKKESRYDQARDKMRQHFVRSPSSFLQAIGVPLDKDSIAKPKQIVDWLTLMVLPTGAVLSRGHEAANLESSSPRSNSTSSKHTLANKSREIERRFKLPQGSVRFSDPDGNLLAKQRSLLSLWGTWQGGSYEIDDDWNVATVRESVEFFLRSPKGSVCIVDPGGEAYHGGTKVRTVRDEHGPS